MADLPILFSAPMVRAILREIEQPGTGKTQTRRVLSNDRPNSLFNGQWADSYVLDPGNQSWRDDEVRYAVGDRLYVREAWHTARSLDNTRPRDIPRDADIEHAATARSYAEIGLKGKLRPAMFLPRWASRITLIVTDVRVQRLQEITEADAIAEGAEVCRIPGIDGGVMVHTDNPGVTVSPGRWYRQIWDSLNAERGDGWDANPWIAAYTFRPILGNIDQIGVA